VKVPVRLDATALLLLVMVKEPMLIVPLATPLKVPDALAVARAPPVRVTSFAPFVIVTVPLPALPLNAPVALACSAGPLYRLLMAMILGWTSEPPRSVVPFHPKPDSVFVVEMLLPAGPGVVAVTVTTAFADEALKPAP
jgi:hypothetical protein